MDPLRFRLDRARAALLVCDVQERLALAMAPADLEAMVRNCVRLVEGAKLLGLPILWTEQYVKGLGPTVAALREAIGERATAVEKLDFSCLVPKLTADLEGRGQLVVCGMETHVCVFQTVRDLEERGIRAFVPGDAVLSRTRANWQVGLDLMRGMGATVTSTETVLFDLTKCAGTDEFRAISKLVK
ncbi:MAG: isochorismatase family protein [Deltaproteobacteria bacterium]